MKAAGFSVVELALLPPGLAPRHLAEVMPRHGPRIPLWGSRMPAGRGPGGCSRTPRLYPWAIRFTAFAQARPELEKALAEWGAGDGEGDDEEDGDDAPAKKGLPEKKKKKLLDARTWERDGRLVAAATALREVLGGEVLEGHNLFRDEVEAALKKLDRKPSGPELKVLLKAVSWRVESTPPVIAKGHKPGKAAADPLHGDTRRRSPGRSVEVCRRIRAGQRPPRH